MNNKYFMVFDVESAGLHGEGFAVGYVVIDRAGNEAETGQMRCDLPKSCSSEDAAWLTENVLPVLPDGSFYRSANPYEVRRWFWQRWEKWKSNDAILVTDCGWPVEANFLTACVNDNISENRWRGPYPLFDISSFLAAAGEDPIGTFPRLPREEPAHNPLKDARQSARVLLMALEHISSLRDAKAAG